jgi:CHRD domain
MKSLSLFGLLILGLVVTGCGGSDTPTALSPASSAMFTAALLPANEAPPVTDGEASGSGTATITFNLTRDSANNITAATMDARVSVTGFPPGTTLIASHIHSGATGTNGGVLVNLGLAAGEVTFATGSSTFTKRGVPLTADQANSIMGNPAAFYLNIHTAANSGGVARGQLTRVQ